MTSRNAESRAQRVSREENGIKSTTDAYEAGLGSDIGPFHAKQDLANEGSKMNFVWATRLALSVVLCFSLVCCVNSPGRGRQARDRSCGTADRNFSPPEFSRAGAVAVGRASVGSVASTSGGADRISVRVAEFLRYVDRDLSPIERESLRTRLLSHGFPGALALEIRSSDFDHVIPYIVSCLGMQASFVVEELFRANEMRARAFGVELLAQCMSHEIADTAEYSRLASLLRMLSDYDVNAFWRAIAKWDRSGRLRAEFEHHGTSRVRAKVRLILLASWGSADARRELSQRRELTLEHFEIESMINDCFDFPAMSCQSVDALEALDASGRDAMPARGGTTVLVEGWISRIARLRTLMACRRDDIRTWSSLVDVMWPRGVVPPIQMDGDAPPIGYLASRAPGEIGADEQSAWFVAEAVQVMRGLDDQAVARLLDALSIGGADVAVSVRRALGGMRCTKWSDVARSSAQFAGGELEAGMILRVLLESAESRGSSRADIAAELVRLGWQRGVVENVCHGLPRAPALPMER